MELKICLQIRLAPRLLVASCVVSKVEFHYAQLFDITVSRGFVKWTDTANSVTSNKKRPVYSLSHFYLCYILKSDVNY